MSVSQVFSRVSVRRDAPISALQRLLVPTDKSLRVGAAHHLVWTLFSDSADRKRDFLWREEKPGVFYILSERVPEDRHGIFEIDLPKPFAPDLRPGDRLAFTLRANATVAKKETRNSRGKPCDVVMNALSQYPSGSRAAVRRELIGTAGKTWLHAQGKKAGFTVSASEEAPSTVNVLGYNILKVDRGHQQATMRSDPRQASMWIGILDFEGVLTVDDPPRFLEALSLGFGRAKAFGCGLMLIRRY